MKKKKTEELTNFAIAVFQTSSKDILSLSLFVCVSARVLNHRRKP